ncbi:uncharacterized protein LOC141657973 [Silene latifolia]|uniref:uncharacterized protein LOC141657973 n=1 Tax=Silene latifolia TaxID=37657 RepID=UPI003D772727
MAGDDTEIKEPPKLEYSNPFYLGPHDVPNIKISNVVLRRRNYDDWKNSISMSLKSRRKFGFIDGSIKKPTDEFFLEQWVVVHCTLVQWIRNTIDDSILDTVSYVDNAAALWSELDSQFNVVDGTLIHDLKTQLHDCKQSKGMDVTAFCGKMKSLWDLLIIHEPPFACKCGKCECDIGPAAIKRLDNERLHQFFMGLDSTLYSNIRSQQFQLDPLPTLSRAYHAVLQEERLRAPKEPTVDVSDVVAFATPAAPSSVDWRVLRDNERGERRQYFCNHCETRGHVVGHCYFKTLCFPEWWGDRPRTLAEYCRSRTAGNRGAGSGGSSGSSGQSSGSAGGSSAGTLSSEKLVHANLLTSGISTNSVLASYRLSGKCNWIIDTGASNNAHLPKRFWSECILTAAYLINRTPSPLIDNKTPYECLFGVAPSYNNLRVFGCLSFAHNQNTRGDKFEKRGRKCVFVGYPHNKKGWKLYDLETETFFVSRDVTFYETHFPFASSSSVPSTPPDSSATSAPVTSDVPFNGTFYDGAASGQGGRSDETRDTGPSAFDTEHGTSYNSETTTPNISSPLPSDPPEVLGRGQRLKIPNSRLKGYVLGTAQSPSSSPDSPSSPTSPSGTPYLIANYINCDKFSAKHCNFIAAVTSGANHHPLKKLFVTKAGA